VRENSDLGDEKSDFGKKKSNNRKKSDLVQSVQSQPSRTIQYSVAQLLGKVSDWRKSQSELEQSDWKIFNSDWEKIQVNGVSSQTGF
jgi:hypothetical protein